jgi:hypothetical protein
LLCVRYRCPDAETLLDRLAYWTPYPWGQLRKQWAPIAAFLLYLREETSKTPNCYFGWTEGNPFVSVVRYILFGEEDTAPVTHEVLREAEPDLERRPNIIFAIW